MVPRKIVRRAIVSPFSHRNFFMVARPRQGACPGAGDGSEVSFLGGDEDPDRVREAYGDPVYDRLVEVKTTYDPDNVFHHNQNIRPRRRSGAAADRIHQRPAIRRDS
jgi:hypothetical protein